MTQAAPFRPTVDRESRFPTTCYCCGRAAGGMGIGQYRTDPKYLCDLCVMIASQIKSVMNFKPYEEMAIGTAVEAVGAYLDEIDKCDLSEFTEVEQDELIRRVVLAFSNGIREAVAENEVPF